MNIKSNNMIKSAFFFFMVTSLLFTSCGEKKEHEQIQKAAPVNVTLGSVNKENQQLIQVSGQIVSEQTANISSRIMGTITKIYVKVGDRVAKGQTLISISSPDMLSRRAQTDANIAAAEANLSNAKKDFDRYTNLYKKQSASAKELDNSTLQYNAAKAGLEAARQMRNETNNMIGYTTITAPFNGVVSQRLADEGNMANPGMPLLTIVENGELQVNAMVSEADINLIKKGTEATAAIKALQKSIPINVSAISPSSSETGGLYLVKFNISAENKKDLYSGMYVNINIPVKRDSNYAEKNQGIYVPATAIIKKDQLSEIYTISEQQTAILRLVRTGKTKGDQVEIISGLSEGEKFILHADGVLYNGVPVQVK